MAAQARTVVLPIDESDHTIRAFSWYMDHLMRAGDRVVFIHIAEPVHLPLMTAKSPLSVPAQEWTEKIQGRIQRLGKLEQDFQFKLDENKLSGAVLIEDINDRSNVGQRICEIVKRESANVVVMGNRGLGKVKRTVLGSVSDYVAHHSSCAVVIVPPPNENSP